MNKPNCPKCHSMELEDGVLTGCVAAISNNVFAPNTTEIFFTACSHCGHILEFRLKNPKVIIKKYNV